MTRPTFVHSHDERPLPCGLYADELDTLSTYNSERGRGLLHDPEWAEAMAELQRRFDEHVERDRHGSLSESELVASLGLDSRLGSRVRRGRRR